MTQRDTSEWGLSTMLKGLKLWPILAGILVDTIGTVTLGALYFLVILGLEIIADAPATDSSLSIVHSLVIELLLGLFFVALGGLVAARMAKALHTQHGIAVGIGSLLFWLLAERISPSESMVLWYELVSLVAVVPAGALGGYLAGRRANKPLQPTSGAAALS